MTFVLRMVGREARASWRRLIFFFLCVAVGVGAIVALRSVIQSVRDGARRGGALADRGRRHRVDVAALDARPARIGRRSGSGRTGATAITEAIETATMVRPADASKALVRAVELQGVEAAFPLYGRVELEGGQRVLARPAARPGRPRPAGAADATRREGGRPDRHRRPALHDPRRRAVRTGPPAGVLQLRSARADRSRRPRAHRAAGVRQPRAAHADGEGPAGGASIRSSQAVNREFQEQFVNARSFRGNEDQIGNDLERAENYLSLVGFIIVILGGIGVWSVTRVFVQQKLRAIAVLKCLGASTRQVLAVYVAQVLALGALGSVLGLLIAWAALAAIPPGALAALGGAVPRLTWSAVLQGTTVGLLVSLLFSLVPLLDIRRVKPLLLLRDDVRSRRRGGAARRPAVVARRGLDEGRGGGPGAGGAGRRRRLAGGVVARRRLVSGAFLAVALVLHLAGLLLVRVVKPLDRAPLVPAAPRRDERHAARATRRASSCSRSASASSSSSASGRCRPTCCREFRIDLRTDGPDLFLIDIQPDQEAGVREFLADGEPGVPGAGHSRAAGARDRRARAGHEPEELRGSARAGRPRAASS